MNSLGRALSLLVLAIHPKIGAPEPAPTGVVVGLVALLLFLGAPAMSFAVWRRLRTLESLAAAILWAVTSIALVVAAEVCSGANAPLLRAYDVAAPLVWLSLALSFASLAGRYLGSSWKGRKALGAIVVLVPGIVIFQTNRDYVSSAPATWKRANTQDPSGESAIAQPDPRTVDRVAELAPALDACVRKSPSSCGCLARRAIVRARSSDVAGAAADVRAAESAQCDLDAQPVRLREVAVTVFALRPDDAADLGRLLDGAKDRSTNASFLYGDAVLALRRGDADEALRLAAAAASAGGDKDAKLFYVQLLMTKGKNAEAKPVVDEILAAFPSDANALYDRALIDDLAGRFNDAREGYLRALKVDPKLKDARYNLAVLTLRAGIAAEAKHHAETFVKDYPDDPRGETLLRITGSK